MSPLALPLLWPSPVGPSAVTDPMGSKSIERSGIQNFDMQEMSNSWPSGIDSIGHETWFHSDIKDVALLYVHPVLKEIIRITGARQ